MSSWEQSFDMGIQIQQMNQRATHFQLGKTSQTYQSIYHQDYPAKQAQSNPVTAANPFRGNSLTHGGSSSFATTHKSLLKPHHNAEIAKLDQATLKQLRSHHFKLGNYNPQAAMTTNKIYHDQKPITGQASKGQEESKKNMRGHHHNFKEQNNTLYRSAYADQYTPKDSQPSALLIDPHAQDAINFGQHRLPMLTTNTSSYTPKAGQPAVAQPAPALGVDLGQANDPKLTINQLYHNPKEPSRAALPQATMKELRGTHFQLGQANLNYRTENHYYQGQPKDPRNKQEIPTYVAGSWVDKQAPFKGTTTYQRELPQRPVEPFSQAVTVTRNGMDLGGHAGSYTSQFKSHFTVPQNPQGNKISVKKKDDVVIGQGANHYMTEHKASFKDRDLKQGRVDVDIKKLNSEDHFKIGGGGNYNKITVFQDQHRPDVHNRNKLFHKTNL